MLELNATVEPGTCEIHTTEYRGFTPEEMTMFFDDGLDVSTIMGLRDQ